MRNQKQTLTLKKFHTAHCAVAYATARATAVFEGMYCPVDRRFPTESEVFDSTFGWRHTEAARAIHGTVLFLGLAHTAFGTWQGENTGVVLTHPAVDIAIACVDMANMRKYRNSVFHPIDPGDDRVLVFSEDGNASVANAVEALAAIGRYLRSYSARVRPREP